MNCHDFTIEERFYPTLMRSPVESLPDTKTIKSSVAPLWTLTEGAGVMAMSVITVVE